MTTNTIPTISKETAIPRVTADTVLDYIRTYGPGELVHTDGLDRDCLCYTIRVCADGTLAAPWKPCDKEVSRHFWLVNGELGTCLPDEGGCDIFHGVGLDLRLMCSLLADDINSWLDDLAYWSRRRITGPEDDHHDLRYVATRCNRVSRADIREAVRDYLQDQMDDITKLDRDKAMDQVGRLYDMADMICEIFGIYVSHDDRHIYVS